MNDYGKRVKNILSSLGEVAEKVGEDYLDVNVPGLTKVSINAHELNTMITLLKSGGFHNKDIHKKMILTCARILEAFDEIEEETRKEAEESNKSIEPEKTKEDDKGEDTAKNRRRKA